MLRRSKIQNSCKERRIPSSLAARDKSTYCMIHVQLCSVQLCSVELIQVKYRFESQVHLQHNGPLEPHKNWFHRRRRDV